MADYNQFGSANPGKSGDPQHCAQCEAMLADALDGTLSPADQAVFDLHMIGCPACAQMLEDAQRGAAWLDLLKSPRPEPSADLIDRILAQTSHLQSTQLDNPAVAPVTEYAAAPATTPWLGNPNTLLGFPAATHYPAARSVAQCPANSLPGNVLPFRTRFIAAFSRQTITNTLLQPRLAMTAAMAFFSVALTLSLTGVKLTDLRAADLRPSSIKRGFYQTNARVVRYYDSLRVVYELESRVRDLQRASDNDVPASSGSESTPKPATTPQQQEQEQTPQQKKPRPHGPGTSRRENFAPTLQLVVGSNRGSHLPVETNLLLPQTFASLFPSVNSHNTSVPNKKEGGQA